MHMNVLYQFNEKYAPYAGVSITSLFENNKNVIAKALKLSRIKNNLTQAQLAAKMQQWGLM